jgi:hypothetical protein
MARGQCHGPLGDAEGQPADERLDGDAARRVVFRHPVPRPEGDQDHAQIRVLHQRPGVVPGAAPRRLVAQLRQLLRQVERLQRVGEMPPWARGFVGLRGGDTGLMPLDSGHVGTPFFLLR